MHEDLEAFSREVTRCKQLEKRSAGAVTNGVCVCENTKEGRAREEAGPGATERGSDTSRV